MAILAFCGVSYLIALVAVGYIVWKVIKGDPDWVQNEPTQQTNSDAE